MLDLFKDVLPAITYTKEDVLGPLDEQQKTKAYGAFMVNRALSQTFETVLFANEMNRRPWLDPQMQFDYLRHSLPKKKFFSKWAKGKEDPKINTLVEVFDISVKKAEEIIDLLSDDDFSKLEQSIFKGGRNGK